MEDSLSPDNQTMAGPVSENASSQPEGPSLGAGYALLRALVGAQIPDGPLGPTTIPAPVLALPIEVATEQLVRHFKQSHPSPCIHVPLSLKLYSKLRPDSIRNAKGPVNNFLWTQPNHSLVALVRKEILENNSSLASDISTGRLLAGDRLSEVLRELGPGGPTRLAAVLWASEFKAPGSEALFRGLVPVIEGATSDQPQSRTDHSSHEDRLRSLGAKFRRAEKLRGQAQKEALRATNVSMLRERQLDRLKLELADVVRKHADTVAEVARLESLVREERTFSRDLERRAEKTTKANGVLRKDFGELKQEREALEVHRSDLARQLAAERHSSEQLRLRLATMPRGPDAVMLFLRAEEQRIQTDRAITAGGAKERAETEWTNYRKVERAFLDAHPAYRQPPPIKILPKAPLRLHALGGSSEIGRSCYLLELGNNRILVDCGIKPGGIKPGTSEDLHPDIDSLEPVHALILTHAHADHIGWVPALVRRFPDLDIYCSEGTAALLPIMLDDCYKQYTRKLTAKRELGKHISNAVIVDEDYDGSDVYRVSNLVIKCSFDEDEALPFGGVSIRLYPAGHVLGAASVLIKDESGRRIFFSGDFSSFPQLTVPAADWPTEIGEVDLLVLESTYGGRDHKPLNDTRRDLVSFARETLEGEGSVILASFGLGRAQELLKLITEARANNELPEVRVYVDGIIKRINPIYRRLASFDLPRDAFYEVTGGAERQDVVSSLQRKPGIIVTTSGMIAGGPVVEYARRLLGDPRNRLVLTGYQDEGAPGRVLSQFQGLGPHLVKIEDELGEVVEFEVARPAKEFGLSAHADQAGLIEYARRLRPKYIALVHGEASAQQELRQRLLRSQPELNVVCGPSDLTVP